MYKKILVPVSFDESRDSNTSLEVAKVLADQGAEVILLHVLEHVPEYARTYLPAGYLESSHNAIEEKIKQIASEVPGGQGVVITGHSGTSILEYADNIECDLIILASHRPGVSDYFLGSTAHHVVRHAKCAVHVVR